METDRRSGGGWLAKLFHRRPRPRPYRPEPQPLAPFEQALDEGMLIAKHGLTLAVKNRLILRALRDHAPFDDEATARIVDEQLVAAADEQRGYVRMMGRARANADLSGGLPDHAHDYHIVDGVTLRRRERLYLALADALDEMRTDVDAVSAISDRARRAAWEDIGDNVMATLDARMPRFDDDPDYVLDRMDRLRQLLEEDLPALESRTKD